MRTHRPVWHMLLPIALFTVLVAPTLSWAQSQDSDKEPRKELTPREQRRLEIETIFRQFRGTEHDSERVIYGADDRLDVYQVSDPFLLGLVQATTVLLEPGDYTNNGNGTYTLNAVRWTTQGGSPVCATEPFRNQYQVGNCSAFLVGQDLMATAGHCIPSNPAGIAFAFDFHQWGPSTDPNLVIPANDIYFVQQVIVDVQAGELDHAVVRLDRPVVGRTPVPIRRTSEVQLNDPLVMIGHPSVLPTKVDDGGVVKNPRPGGGWFYANVDAYGGNSGSAVFNLNTGVVEGILVRGNTDYETVGGCTRSRVCPDTGCSGDWEEISKTISFASVVPELGITVSPAAAPLHVGPVGGPFNDATVVYTLNNLKNAPADYTVSIQAGGTAPILINGGPGPVNGTIPANSTANVTVALAAAANGLPAGTYASSVLFQDTTNNLSTTRTHTIEVGQTGFTVTPVDGLTAGGPLGGPFNATKVYALTSTRPTPVTINVAASANWISIDGGTAPQNVVLNGTGASANVTIGFSANANSLPNGIYNGTVSFTNQSLPGTGDTTRPVLLDVGRYTYASSDVPKPIADNSTVNSTLNVSDVYCIGDVDICADITHSYVGDLIVELISPAGTVVRLHNRTGGSADNLVKCYDQGVVSPDGPGTLDDFAGEFVNGTWTLRVSDNASSDTGALNAWSLKVASSGSVCPPVASDLSLVVPDTLKSPVTLQAASSLPGALQYVITSLPAHGALYDPAGGLIGTVPYTLLAHGAVVNYKPTPLYIGDDSFNYKANDGQDSNVATVDLSIGSAEPIYAFPLDTNPGWSVENQWAFGQPTGQSGDPSSGHTGTNVYGFNLNGDYPHSMTTTYYLTSGPLDFSGVTQVSLQFWRWLGVERSQYDHATIGVSNNNGASWTVIWENPLPSGTSIDETAWSFQTYDISALADGYSQVRVRWGMGPTDSSVAYHGWNIDDIEFHGAAPVGMKGDVDCDGDIDFFDIDPFVVALGGEAAYYAVYPDCIWSLADTDCDGDVDFFDIDPFVACLTDGICACQP